MPIVLENFFQALVAGILVGGMYGLMCVGLGVIFGVMRVINFAQGEFLMLGMYVAYYLVTGFEPFMTQDSICTYGDMWIFKEALEKAGTADRAKVAEAIRAMDTTTGPARYFAGGRVKFEKNGRRAGAPVVVIQWQGGEPLTVYPLESAFAPARWSKR